VKLPEVFLWWHKPLSNDGGVWLSLTSSRLGDDDLLMGGSMCGVM